MNYGKNKVFICDCCCLEHQFRVAYFPPDEDILNLDDDYVYIDFHLNESQGFFRRLWVGVKYIFGFKCKYGSFDEVILSPSQTLDLRDFLNEALRKENA